ncbi:Ala-tRNA(Pro) deacylase [Mesorhizobium soli]|uniref:aminoacyl-tRNA deacylase n=1 Tax=Pseudaminobacter soli (ex Li et al. 2025) TaxID=1295366 RepID=UPI002476CD81|nr:YbaK/EbsC family protein [Mesorhizobium soli]MDH6229535.1 Ala-tRNA(Pro) deacylase [Mesorhizobium soli]
MTIAPTLQAHLERKGAEYDLVEHKPTSSSIATARACHIPAGSLAKAVVLRGRDGYLLAVLPASSRLRLAGLKTAFGERFTLATEHELDQLIPDCTHGAVPAIGECYGLDVIVEDNILQRPEVYFEGGDHATLVHMRQAQFARLTEEAPHGRFSARSR